MALVGLTTLGGLFLLLGTSVQAEFTVVSTVSSSLPTSQDAEYVCFFESLWTAANHPNDYPGNAGFSEAIIIVHSSEYNLFEEGAVVSAGMKLLAETGSIIDVVNEIFAVNGQEDNMVVDTVVGTEIDLGSVQRQTLRDVEVDDMHALLSAAAKISPSPDWFTGFSDFDPRDSATNSWFYEFRLQTPPYDAGTQEGETYLQSLGGTTPAEPIVEITSSNAPASGVFLNSAGDAVLPVAEWRCRLVNGQAATPGAPPATTPVPTLSPVVTVAPTAALSATSPPIMPTTVAPSFAPPALPNTTAKPTSVATTTEQTAEPAAIPVAELATSPPTATPTAGPSTAEPTEVSSTTGLSDAPSSSPTETAAVSVPTDQDVQNTSVPTLSPVETSSASPSDYPTVVPTLEPSDAPSDIPTNVPATEPPTNEPTTAGPTSTEAPVSDPAEEEEVDSTLVDDEEGNVPVVQSYAPSYAPSMQPSTVPTTETDADRGGNQIAGLESTSTAGVMLSIHLITWIMPAVVVILL